MESERSTGMGDAGVEDIAAFRSAEEPPASAVSGCSDDRRAGSGGRPYRGDSTGAAPGSELAAAA
eukprot:2180755-Alexandrium_andersonii.AAC.1